VEGRQSRWEDAGCFGSYDGLRRERKIPEIETLSGAKAEEMRGNLKEKNKSV
jgi:hypothetical protein